MKFMIFSKNLTEDSLARVYVLQGTDAYFLKTARKKILSACKIENSEMNLSTFDETKKDDFFASLNSFPLMSKLRASTITIDKQDDEFFKKLSKYATNPNSQAVVIVTNNAKAVAQKDGIVAVDCGKENLETLFRWVLVTFKKNGKTIDTSLAEILVTRCNYDMMRISSSVDIIISYMNQQKTVTSKMINELVVLDIDAEIFALSDAIIKNDANYALALYSKFKSQKIDDTQIIATLYGNYRRMFLSAVTNKTNEEIASELKVKPFSIKMAREQAKRFTKSRLKASLDILVKLENGIKTGKLTNPNAVQVGILTLIGK